LCKDGPKEGAIEEFFDLGFVATVKTKRFSWPVYSSPASSAKLDIVEFGISWEPSDYSIQTNPRVPDQNNGN